MRPLSDLTGQRFGRLVAVERDVSPGKRHHWLCQCDCGTLRSIYQYSLTKGSSRSCGCLRPSLVSAARMAHDLTGKRFGRLLVSREGPRVGKWKERTWDCACDCGVQRRVRQGDLMAGHSRSCGCLIPDIQPRLKHGQNRGRGKRTSEYGIWRGMLTRCNNPNSSNYHLYGARGIKVCHPWHEFEAFLRDMGPRPTARHSIERQDNNGDYCPENCVWADHTTQCNNKRSNRLIALGNETHTLTEWSRLTGIPCHTIRARLCCPHWTVEDALTRPVRPHRTNPRRA
jgi:hypothetical protein